MLVFAAQQAASESQWLTTTNIYFSHSQVCRSAGAALCQAVGLVQISNISLILCGPAIPGTGDFHGEWQEHLRSEWMHNASCMFYMPASPPVSSAAFLQLAKATTWPCQRQCWGKIEASSSCGNPETSHRKRLRYIILIQEHGELVAIIQATTELIMENIGK